MEYVLGRKDSASGPLLDVSLVVVSSEDINRLAGNQGGDRGLEARVKMKVDDVKIVLSIPFFENLAQYVAVGPLLPEILRVDHGDGDSGGTAPALRAVPQSVRQSSSTLAASSVLAASVAVDGEESNPAYGSSRSGEVGRGGVLPLGLTGQCTRKKGDKASPIIPGEDSTWKPFVMIKAG